MMYEILSPCGSMEAFLAAISAGADAVYLAGKMFGARSFANNFTDEELVYVINYAHLYGVKVYVTCNILIFEHEVENFLNFIEFLHKNNVDAVIMQDIGMIDLVHKTFPNLEIYGSTQMHIHNLEGAFMAKALGLKRIVLARETPLTLVKEIKEKTGLEVEVFVHGALCVSYSGMCLFAASIGPRSGNRGTCSGCCRLPYQVLNSKKEVLNTEKYPLSMKDLMTLQELDKLIAAGVDSFKIEGRMKSPSYVYTTTKLYKETRDNYLKTKKIVINKKDIYNLKNIFARPYTKGYLLNANNNDVIFPKSPNHQGVKVGEVVKTSKNLVKIKCSDTISIHDGLRIVNDDFEYGLVLNEFRKNNKQVYKAFKNDYITFRVNKLIPINSRVIRTYASEIEDNISNEIKNKKRRVPISLKIIIQKEKPIKLIITDFKINGLENLDYFTNWKIIETEGRETILTDYFELYIIELPKIYNKRQGEEDKLFEWMRFLENPVSREVEVIMKNNDGIKKAKEKLEEISNDEIMQKLAEWKEAAAHDEASTIATAKIEEKRNIAIKMIRNGIKLDLIKEITGLSEEEIKTLANK